MKNIIKELWRKIPNPDSFSLSWPPSINFPLKKYKDRNNLKHFEDLVEKAQWKKEFIDHKEIWVCEKDNTFQIEIGECGGDFQESWVEVYPDRNGQRYPVYLKINNTTIKELAFIACDGGRIFVPMPERRLENEHIVFSWRLNSLPLKVCKIIGHYYIHKNIEGIAQMSNIGLV